MKRIILIIKGRIESLPPFMSLAIELSILNQKVIIIATECDNKTKELFHKYNIEIVTLNHTKSSKYKIVKIIQWLKFRNQTFELLKQMDFDYLWIGGGDTALALGKKVLSSPYIISVYELYDKNYIYRYFLKKTLKSAKSIVVPERNRAAILRSWYNLDKLPFIIPNKPYMQNVDLSLDEEITNSFSKDKKIALYQGHIGKDRDLEPICDSFNEMNQSWQLILMGKDHNYLNTLKKICPSLIHISHIQAPGHLAITNCADIGLVSYTYDNLNNVFCAPNKIWEYSSFSKPMIGNDVPGLLDTIDKYDAGKCVDFSNVKELKKAILTIENQYEKYSIGSKKLFNSVDISNVLKEIIKSC